MNKELVHPRTCAHDHTAPNCNQSLLDLHIDVKAQSEASIATFTMEQQLELVDCEPPVTMQCSPVSLDTHIDQTDLHVQSPAPCAQYSHTHIMPQFTMPALCLHQSNWQTPADLQIITY